jgi:protein-S-isoprenylcysteine O-methyltransferase Ste14
MVVVSREIAGGFWLLFCVVWLVTAFGVKPNIAGRPWWLRLPVRLTILAVVILIFGLRLRGAFFGRPFAPQAVLAPIGAALCVAGISYAIWARMVIGRNWGMPMTLKADHELVTTGPYARVRHPIYAGILLAMVGSALVFSPWWLLILLLNGAQFFYAARKEEKLMLQTFPESYGEYMRRTWMFIRFLF